MSLRVGLVGFGTVGQSVARALAADHRQRIRLARVCARPGGRPRPPWLSSAVDWTNRFHRLLEADIDVVVELVGGLSPARNWIERALEAGKPVVTANKELIAEFGPALVAADSPVGRARGCDNVIVVTGELGGDTVYSGQGAGGNPTAVAVVSDLLAIAADRKARSLTPRPGYPSPFPIHSTVSKGPQHHA